MTLQGECLCDGEYRDFAPLDTHEVEDEETETWTLDGRDHAQEVFHSLNHMCLTNVVSLVYKKI